MANGDQQQQGTLSKVVGSIGSMLPYAIPAALGAAMGGPMGALAGAASATPQTDPYKAAELGLREQELGLKGQEVEQTEKLKEAQLASTEEQRRATDLYRQQSLDSLIQTRHDAATDRLLNLKREENNDKFRQDYMASMEGLRANETALREQMAQATDQTRRDALQEKIDANTKSRIAGAQTLADRQAKEAVVNRSFRDKWLPGTPSADASYDKFYENALTTDLAHLGFKREDLLNAGLDTGIVDKIAPEKKADVSAPKGYAISAHKTKDGKPIYENPMAPKGKRYWTP